ncbi:elongation factor P [Xanthomonas oryzae pv. oryzae KACC 10331]|nr:elongation factor P [Xanthomonas oryzae pv. oryzae KACC 10331]
MAAGQGAGMAVRRGGLRLSCEVTKPMPAGCGGRPILIRPATAWRVVVLSRSCTMATVGMNDVKNGMKILVNNEPAVITETEYVKPGKGQAFTRMKYRFIKSGRVVEMTMKATDDVEVADVVDTDMRYLYSDGEYWHFMDPETFEQVQTDKAGMGGADKWLKGEEDCIVTLWNGAPIWVQPPNFVELKITETDPGVRGDTSGGGGKPATLETGAVVRVPLFVNQDEIIKVDTRSGEYSARVK